MNKLLTLEDKRHSHKHPTLRLIYGLTLGIFLFVIFFLVIVNTTNKNLRQEQLIILKFHDRTIAESINLISSLYHINIIILESNNQKELQTNNRVRAELAQITRQKNKLTLLQTQYPQQKFQKTLTRIEAQVEQLLAMIPNPTGALVNIKITQQRVNAITHSTEQLHLLHQIARDKKIKQLARKSNLAETLIYLLTITSLFIGLPLIYFILKRVSLEITIQKTTLSELQLAHREMKRLAFYDPLTKLPNRRLFKEFLEQAITTSGRTGRTYGLFYIDIDNFKNINDSFGHDVGDQLLIAVSNHLIKCCRSMDRVSRIGGDEFNLLMEDINNEVEASLLAKKILNALSPSIKIDHHEIFVSLSIGITILPNDSNDMLTLLKYADLAMYQVKLQGKNSYRFYDKSLNDAVVANMQLENKLRKAILNNEFVVYYQPQIDLKELTIVGFEALIRWNDPQREIISPLSFIPLAESVGLIEEIGRWVISQVSRDLNTLIELTNDKIKVAINISARQMRDPELLSFIRAEFEQYQVNPNNIDIEITESMLMDDIEQRILQLADFQEFGIGVAIDDFGTGYSSLSYLNKLPLNTLKIDRSFIQHIVHDTNDMKIVSTIIAMGHNLNLTVIAEGVETKEQLKLLTDENCDLCQGYLFSQPLPLNELLVSNLLFKNETAIVLST